MNIENTLNTAIKTLTQFNIQNANLDSEILLAKIIGKDRNYIILNSKEHLNQKVVQNALHPHLLADFIWKIFFIDFITITLTE